MAVENHNQPFGVGGESAPIKLEPPQTFEQDMTAAAAANEMAIGQASVAAGLDFKSDMSVQTDWLSCDRCPFMSDEVSELRAHISSSHAAVPASGDGGDKEAAAEEPGAPESAATTTNGHDAVKEKEEGENGQQEGNGELEEEEEVEKKVLNELTNPQLACLTCNFFTRFFDELAGHMQDCHQGGPGADNHAAKRPARARKRPRLARSSHALGDYREYDDDDDAPLKLKLKQEPDVLLEEGGEVVDDGRKRRKRGRPRAVLSDDDDVSNGDGEYEPKVEEESGDDDRKEGEEEEGGRDELHLCEQCSYSSFSRAAVRRHIKAKHAAAKNLFKCRNCQQGYKSRHLLLNHMEKEHQDDEKLLKFKCEKCPHRTRVKSRLVYHMKHGNHDGEERAAPARRKNFFSCQECNFETPSELVLKGHIQKCHEEPPAVDGAVPATTAAATGQGQDQPGGENADANRHSKFACTQCPFRSDTKREVNMHVKLKHLQTSETDCPKCTHNAKTVDDLAVHMERWHYKDASVFQFHCDKCDYKTILQARMDDHEKEGKHEMYTCQHCEKRWLTEIKLKYHIANVHKYVYDRLKCAQCDASYTTKRALRDHMAYHHPTGNEKVFKCKHCDFSTVVSKTLNSHVKGVHYGFGRNIKKATYPCLFCEHKADSQREEIQHVKQMHYIGGEFTCTKCSFKTPMRRKLATHFKIDHLAMQPINCDQCDFVAFKQCDLRIHIRGKHLKEYKYKCDYENCPFKSLGKALLTHHVNLVHLKIKKAVCEHCGYKAVSQSVLDNHIEKVHMKIRSFSCPHCDYRAENNYKLTQHINGVHLQQKSQLCDLCGFRATKKRTLDKHKKEQHGMKIDGV